MENNFENNLNENKSNTNEINGDNVSENLNENAIDMKNSDSVFDEFKDNEKITDEIMEKNENNADERNMTKEPEKTDETESQNKNPYGYNYENFGNPYAKNQNGYNGQNNNPYANNQNGYNGQNNNPYGNNQNGYNGQNNNPYGNNQNGYNGQNNNPYGNNQNGFNVYNNYNGNMPEQKQSRGFGIASLCLGIASILLCCIPFLNFILSIIGLVLGIVGRSKNKTDGIALAGIIVSAFGIAFSILMIMVVFLSNAFESIINDMSSYDSDSSVDTIHGAFIRTIQYIIHIFKA